jgi:hypothetical protein
MLYKMDGVHKILHQERANRLSYKNMKSYKKRCTAARNKSGHILTKNVFTSRSK